MASQVSFSNDFEFFDSSDDGSPLPALNFEENAAPPQPVDAVLATDKGLNSTLHPGNDGLSPKSSQSSTVESTSTKRTDGTSSTKTSYSGGDVAMTDRVDVKEEWKPEDFIHDDEDRTFTLFDGTVDPSAIENHFDFTAGQMQDQWTFNSASTSPGSVTAPATETASPSEASPEAQPGTQALPEAAAFNSPRNMDFSVCEPLNLAKSPTC
jgi:hypothetical protein